MAGCHCNCLGLLVSKAASCWFQKMCRKPSGCSLWKFLSYFVRDTSLIWMHVWFQFNTIFLHSCSNAQFLHLFYCSSILLFRSQYLFCFSGVFGYRSLTLLCDDWRRVGVKDFCFWSPMPHLSQCASVWCALWTFIIANQYLTVTKSNSCLVNITVQGYWGIIVYSCHCLTVPSQDFAIFCLDHFHELFIRVTRTNHRIINQGQQLL